MKHQPPPEMIIISKKNADREFDRQSSGSSSSSVRIPQDHYFDIQVTPLTDIKSPPSTPKNVRNRLRAFELASRALRDVPQVTYDPLDAYSNHDAPGECNRRPSSFIERKSKKSESVLDFGNHSDSRMLAMRREKIRRESKAVHDPSRHWGDLTHHNSSTSDVGLLPKSPPTYTKRVS